MNIDFKHVSIKKPNDMNFILGQSHFIKTIEDIYEAIVCSQPAMKFGTAFCEASRPSLVRFCGNNDRLEKIACENALLLSCRHCFLIFMENGYPLNILNQIKMLPEVCRIFCATANPAEVIIAENQSGRGIMGVIAVSYTHLRRRRCSGRHL